MPRARLNFREQPWVQEKLPSLPEGPSCAYNLPMSDLSRDINAIAPWRADPAAYFNYEFGYDGLGRRVWTQENSGNGSWFIYDGDQLVQERDFRSDALVVEYAWGPTTGAPAIFYQKRIIADVPKEHWIYTSPQGGFPRHLFDDTGAITDTFQYSSFGELVFRTGTTEVDFGWEGVWLFLITGQVPILLENGEAFTPKLAKAINRNLVSGLLSEQSAAAREFADGPPFLPPSGNGTAQRMESGGLPVPPDPLNAIAALAGLGPEVAIPLFILLWMLACLAATEYTGGVCTLPSWFDWSKPKPKTKDRTKSVPLPPPQAGCCRYIKLWDQTSTVVRVDGDCVCDGGERYPTKISYSYKCYILNRMPDTCVSNGNDVILSKGGGTHPSKVCTSDAPTKEFPPCRMGCRLEPKPGSQITPPSGGLTTCA